MEAISRFERQYRLKANFVYVIALYLFFRRLISNSLLTQLDHPAFVFSEKQWAYKLFYASHMAQFLTSNTVVASLFDISLLVFAGAFMLSYKRVYAIGFTLLVTVYFFTYNIITGHHYHGLLAMIAATIPFWFSSEKRFNFSWEAIRYYWLYVFASAAIWKICRGSVFETEQLSNILKGQQLDMLLQNPGFRARIAEYLISHTGISYAILWLNVVFQLSFLIGFFTKRFDAILFVMALLFVIANYFVMGIVSIELLILNVTLLNWDWVEAQLVKTKILTA